MNITEILDIVKVILLAGFIFVIYLSVSKITKVIQSKLDTKNKELEQDKVKLYSTIDTKLVKQELQLLIQEYTARYMTKNIMVNHVNFIKNDQIDDMVKSIVKDTVLEMSDLYLTYCKLLYNVNNEDDLLKVVYYLTVDIVLDVVTRFNGDNNE